MRTAMTVAGLALALGGLVGCGDDGGGGGGGGGGADGLSRGASSEEFCTSFQTFSRDIEELGDPSDPEPAVEALQDFSDQIRELGVPDSATDEEVEGLEITLDAIDDFDGDTTLEDIGRLEDDLSESDQEKTDAFSSYLDEECGEIE